MNKIILLIALPGFAVSSFMCSCNGENNIHGKTVSRRQRLEAAKDSIEFHNSMELKKLISRSVTADAETIAVCAGIDEDAADDPAWFAVLDDSVRFMIAGSNKVAGIHLYEINGDTAGFYKIGRINNIDARTVGTLDNDSIIILAGSNRDQNSITIISYSEFISDQEPVISNIVTKMNDVYGFCLYHSQISGNLYAFVNSKRGRIEQYRLDVNKDSVTGTLVRKLSVRSQPEGMAADDRTGILYAGEEKNGIHIFDAEPEGSTAARVLKGSDSSNKNIQYDIEGLALYRSGLNEGYLIASSQGNFSYAVFDLKTESYITSFRIEGTDPDGVEETDGLDIIDRYISEEYPEGILIVQDGFNTSGGKPEAQNFKIIDWRKIRSLLNAITVE